MKTFAAGRLNGFLSLDEARAKAEQRSVSVAEAEVTAVQKSLKDLYPSDTSITIQLLQPVKGGRLVDVGPRPVGSPSGFVSQSTQSGVTGRLVLERQFLDHFFPSDDSIGQQKPGTFSEELIALERARYPQTGNWRRDAPPSSARIRQVPLLPLPLTMQPRRTGTHYRYADLGVTYTVTAAHPTQEQDALVKRLSLYALRAGEIVQRIRYRSICGGDRCLSHLTECRLLVSRAFPESNRWDETYSPEHGEISTTKIENLWRDNRDGGLCRLVGTLILHHHWWFQYDPIAFHILQSLTGSAENAEAIFWWHLCVPPRIDSIKLAQINNRPLPELVDILCEDIADIVGSYRHTPLSEVQKSRITDAVLAMLLQLAGNAESRYITGDPNEGVKLQSRKPKAWNARTLGALVPVNKWPKDIINRLTPNTACICSNGYSQKASGLICLPVITESMIKTPEYDHCQFVLGLLAPGDHPAPHERKKETNGTGYVFARCQEHGEVLWIDRNGGVPHFLYWHTRAMHAWNKWRNGKGNGSTSN